MVASSIAWTHDVAHTHFPAHPPLAAAKILACGAMTNSDFFDRRLVATGDGSHSLYLPACNEHYHSSHGALRESQHIFIGCGYDEMAVNAGGRLRILEVGFGTGLNALLTWERCDQGSSAVEYVAIEAFPVTVELASQLNYASCLASPAAQEIFAAMHQCSWGIWSHLGENFSLLKLQTRIEDFEPVDPYDLVYFDAFSPPIQPELWTRIIFDKLYRCMRRGAVLVTYCAKGEVKRNLKAGGFLLESLPGPPGKREITRARKP